MRWRGEWFVEPDYEIAISEEIHPQPRHEIGQTPDKPGRPLQIAQHQHRDQCRPNLRLSPVAPGADERFDPQVLLQGLEKQFNLPAILADGGDGGGAEAGMIGEKHQGIARVITDGLHPAQ